MEGGVYGGPNLATLLIASDAQADTSPTGGFISLVDGALWGAFCHFKAVLGTWGYQEGDSVTCIAVCKRSEIITTLGTSGTEFVVGASCCSLTIQPVARTHQGYLVEPVSEQQWNCFTCFVNWFQAWLRMMSGLSSSLTALTTEFS